MVWPASVQTRLISFGKAVVLETGADLSLRVVTKASRSLVSRAEGFRMETLSHSAEVSNPGESITFLLPITNQAGWLDARTRQPITVGPNQHTHLYTTVMTIYRDGTTVATYEIGPYPIPSGIGTIDADTMLVPSGTLEGTLVPLPQVWSELIAAANAAVNTAGTTAGHVLTSNGPGQPPSYKALPAGTGGGTGGGTTPISGTLDGGAP